MKNFKVIFINGRLVEAGSGKEIFLVPGKYYYLNGDDDAFSEKDYMENKKEPLDSHHKEIKIKQKYKYFMTEKILPAGTLLYFRIGLGKITREDKAGEYLFQARLHEDLYLKSKNKEEWTLCECQCISEKIIDGELPFIFQRVKGTSLANLYANVVIHYFAGKRSTACNAFNTFKLNKTNDIPNLQRYKMSNSIDLDKLRSDIIIKYKKKGI